MKFDQLPEKAEFVEHVFYWECRLNGLTAILAGPFLTPEIAQKSADWVSPICVQYRPETRKATFGVMRVKAPGCGAGIYNETLPPELMGELLIDTGFRSN